MDVEIKDIPESMVNMVDIVGIRKFLEITKIYGGSSVYIPLYKSIIRPARDRDIIKKYNGFNEKELAKMYNISVYKTVLGYSPMASYLYFFILFLPSYFSKKVFLRLVNR